MKPHKVQFYIYAESEEEVAQLENSLRQFVVAQYNKGVLVTARKLATALIQFANNIIVQNYLKK